MGPAGGLANEITGSMRADIVNPQLQDLNRLNAGDVLNLPSVDTAME